MNKMVNFMHKEFLTISNTPERTGHSSLYHTQYSHISFESFSTALLKKCKKKSLKYGTEELQKEIIFIKTIRWENERNIKKKKLMQNCVWPFTEH